MMGDGEGPGRTTHNTPTLAGLCLYMYFIFTLPVCAPGRWPAPLSVPWKIYLREASRRLIACAGPRI